MGSVRRAYFGAVMLFALCSPSSIAAEYDLTTPNSFATINDAIFQQINPDTAAGSGVFDSFLRIQGPKASEQSGYNTDGTVEFDTKSGVNTHSLLLGAVPIVTIGGIDYREFCLDINQDGLNFLSLDELKIHIETVGDLTGYPVNFGPVIYDIDAGGDNGVKLNYQLNAGSGKGDMDLLVPSSLFGTDNSKYVYLYSKLGVNYPGDDGFEEWGVGYGGPIIPEPATMALLGLGGLILLRKRSD
jgi:hypothetical protein